MESVLKDNEVIDAFQMTWGNYPAPVMLIRKNRDIVAVNKNGAEHGIGSGIKCFSLCGSEKVCEHCKANDSLKKMEAIREVGFSDALNIVTDGYWIPVEGSDNLYIHFGNNISEYAKPEMFPSNQ